jgi:hypothetical protein
MPVSLATQEAEIRRIVVQSQHRQIVLKTLSQKHPSQKRVGVVALSLNPSTTKKKKVPGSELSMGTLHDCHYHSH